MNVGPGDNKSVTLLPHDKTIKQSLGMVLFTITNFDLVNATVSGEGIRMTITLKRKIMSEMMTTYFPSLLLMMITYATTFFKPFFFEAALSVNLTTMLVMTTIFISKMEGLPPTSDIKMIDIWLILCQLVPFTQVVLLTAMEYLRKDDKQGEDQAGDIDELQRSKTTKEEEIGESELLEAWKIAPVTYEKLSAASLLTSIGEFYEKLYMSSKIHSHISSLRDESDAYDYVLCHHRLLWYCCKFLF